MRRARGTPLAAVIAGALVLAVHSADAQESLPALAGGRAPQTFEELWAGYDPRREPVETEVLKEWSEDDVVLRVVRFRVGVFKGQKALLAAVYGFPRGTAKRPGLVQIHGGGQYADARAPLTNAQRGYATISIAWAGRISAPAYNVGPAEVELFWAGRKDDPRYRLTTDWGPLDGYHAPSRNPRNQFPLITPAEWTLDAVPSPRNSSWFLCALAARRALTFLEQQPEVDPARLGVYGHSMGGKLTVMTTAADRRVKAAAPSCGGISDRPADNPLFAATLGDGASLKHVACPIAFLSPSNDFHGRMGDLPTAAREITSSQWRLTCSPHHNHQDTAAYQVVGPLWFDQHLKGTFTFPQTPQATLVLRTPDGVPTLSATPDERARKVVSVDIFYTQQGPPTGANEDRENAIARYWHVAKVQRSGQASTAALPLLDTDRPLWAYANVLYALDSSITAAGYYYGIYTATTFNLSSVLCVATPEQLQAAGVRATDRRETLIESFQNDWRKAWFTYDLSDSWPRRTHKVYDPKWKAPAGAKLAFDVRCESPNTLVVGLDDWAAEVRLAGGAAWQPVLLAPGDFRNAAGTPRTDWKGLRELRLVDRENLAPRQRGAKGVGRMIGAPWKSPAPEFRHLRWEGGEAAGNSSPSRP